MTIRVGIDATAMPPKRVGAGRYIFSLVRGLAEVDQTNHYIVFAKPEHVEEWGLDRPNWHFIPSATRIRPLRLAWEQVVLPNLVRRYRIDVLHSPHYTMPLLCPSPVIVTFCDMIFFLYPNVHSRTKQIFFSRMMRLSAARAKALVTISHSTAKDLLQHLSVPPGRVHPIPLAADESFRPMDCRADIQTVCQKYGLNSGGYLLYVGLLEPRKNIPTLLQAYRAILDRGVHEQLAIVGRQGWMFGEIFEAVHTLGLEDKVIFTGYVPDHELPYLYNGARVFVYPSLYEGFGLPVLEALACGTPVVTSGVSSMPEIAGEAAVLVDPHDVLQLARALEDVIADEHLRHSLRQRGLQRAAQFSWQRTARETIQVYEWACGVRP